MNRSHQIVVSSVGVLTCVALLAACGGGGGGSSPTPPHPTPTPTGAPPPALSCNNSNSIKSVARSSMSHVRHTQSLAMSQYTFASNPTGLAVFINASAAGKTSFTTTPAYTNQPYEGIIKASSTASYGICYAQLANGNHTIFYNSAADTSGKIGTISTSSMERAQEGRHMALRGLVARMPMIRHNSHPYDMHRIQVLINAGTFADDERAASALEQRLGALHGETLGPLYNGALDRIVSIPPNVSPQQFVQRFIGQPGVVDARTLPMRYTQASTPFFPNDAFFDPVNQWDLAGGGTPGLGAAPSGIGTPWAWGYTRGTSNVHIAIIDTGADLTAFDLQGKVDYSVAWVSSEQPYPNHNPGAAQDEDGHGTNVTGIAAADTNNSGYGFAGTGFNTPLQIYRIFPKPVAPCYETCSDYGASTADEANAIIDAINHHARVINLSLGSCEAAGGGPDPTEFNAIQTAIARGLVVVAAAGNERSGGGSDGCTQSNTIDFPAGYPGVISAGATSLHDNGSGNPNTATEYVASYSNSGPGLSVVAPGGDPPSSSDSDPLHWITNLYSSTVANPAEKCQPVGGVNPKLCAALFAGTSQATPHVTGVAALMFSRNPALSPARVRAIIQSTADNINDPNQGHGRLDAYRALAAVVGDTTKLPAPTAVNFVAIAYTVSPGSNRPNILNQTFTFGVPLAINGTFRLVDVLPSAPNFEIGLWYDANGDGVVNAGDYFGKAGPCTATAPCSAAGTIPVAPVPPGFVLQ